jgi:hypothetical protein
MAHKKQTASVPIDLLRDIRELIPTASAEAVAFFYTRSN